MKGGSVRREGGGEERKRQDGVQNGACLVNKTWMPQQMAVTTRRLGPNDTTCAFVLRALRRHGGVPANTRRAAAVAPCRRDCCRTGGRGRRARRGAGRFFPTPLFLLPNLTRAELRGTITGSNAYVYDCTVQVLVACGGNARGKKIKVRTSKFTFSMATAVQSSAACPNFFHFLSPPSPQL